MSLLEKFDQDLKQAMKDRDEIRLSVIRSIRTALKNKQVQLKRELKEDEILGTVTSQAKQRKDSIEQFEKGGRDDLVQREKAELAILEEYLPKQLGEDEIASAIDAIIAEVGASSIKEMGKVMKALMAKYAGKIDGKIAGEMVKSRLAG